MLDTWLRTLLDCWLYTWWWVKSSVIGFASGYFFHCPNGCLRWLVLSIILNQYQSAVNRSRQWSKIAMNHSCSSPWNMSERESLWTTWVTVDRLTTLHHGGPCSGWWHGSIARCCCSSQECCTSNEVCTAGLFQLRNHTRKLEGLWETHHWYWMQSNNSTYK